jgi:photosystem II stability/assembly factor-like uncharacterized protein
MIQNQVDPNVEGAIRWPLPPALFWLAGLMVWSQLLPASDWKAAGPAGGDAEFVRFLPRRPNTALAGTREGLLYLSHDHGQSWDLIDFPGAMAGRLHVLEVDPDFPDTWYAGMEADQSWHSGLYKTIDGGRTWTQLPGLAGRAIWSLAIFPTNGRVLAAGAADGVYLSADGGKTWKRISPESNLELRPVVSLAFHPTRQNVIYAGTPHLPWRTTDGGARWESIHTGMIDDSDVFSIQSNRAAPNVVVASACSGVYRSTNAGAGWTRLPTPPGAFRTYFVTQAPWSGELLYAGTSAGLFRSSNTGHTWSRVTGDRVGSLSFDPSRRGRILIATEGHGIQVSVNGGAKLDPSSRGFTNRNFAASAVAGSTVYLATAYEPVSGGLFRSNDGGAVWQRVTGSDKLGNILSLAAEPSHPEHVFAAGRDGLFASEDGGRTWSRQTAAPPETATVVAALDDGTVLLGTELHLYRRSPGGSWNAVELRPNPGRIQLIDEFAGSQAVAASAHQVYRTADGGATWRTCGTLPEAVDWYGFSMAAYPNGPVVALAATSHGLFRSTDGCASWQAVRQGLQDGTVSAVLFQPGHPGEAYASQFGGLFHSTDSGAHWEASEKPTGTAWAPSAMFIPPALSNRLVALFPRRGILYASLDSQSFVQANQGGSGK